VLQLVVSVWEIGCDHVASLFCKHVSTLEVMGGKVLAERCNMCGKCVAMVLQMCGKSVARVCHMCCNWLQTCGKCVAQLLQTRAPNFAIVKDTGGKVCIFATPSLDFCNTDSVFLQHRVFGYCSVFATPSLHFCNTGSVHLQHPVLANLRQHGRQSSGNCLAK
jgi:hypothetical protein